jgi:exonuclease SbcC
MDDAAFRASVFAEQKQLASFSSQSPAERRKLILQLLGITPLDSARDSARKDARVLRDQHDRSRSLLPDLEILATGAADADAEAGACEAVASDEQAAAAKAEQIAKTADSAFAEMDLLRQRHEGLVIEGRGARATLEGAVESIRVLNVELAQLNEAGEALASLDARAEGGEGLEAWLRGVQTLASARAELDATPAPVEAPVPDETVVARAQAQLDISVGSLATLEGQITAVSAELERARQQAARSAQLSGAGDCPLCGQALDEAFEQVQAHRLKEVTDADARRLELVARRLVVSEEVKEARGRLEAAQRGYRDGLARRSRWEQASAARTAAQSSQDKAGAALLGLAPPAGRPAAGEVVGLESRPLALLARGLEEDLRAKREAAAAADRLRGRLERRPGLLEALERAERAHDNAEMEVSRLLEAVKILGYEPKALESVTTRRKELYNLAETARLRAGEARTLAIQRRANAEGEARRLADARAQHAKLSHLESEARHLSRLAELLSTFRNTVVATVGPRLALQAAELFDELTDREYDRLEVDPETYQIQIRDAGHLYPLERFSGSEVDLANLALRVAISEHVRFQSGGVVGLLVLDEVFGPLDEDRKARTLMALERLKGRFRQVLVVTHDEGIKEQLPAAIEVIKRPGRRATAHLLNA